ncbi:MAG: sigma-54 dependent transcriptional regulator [Desulfobacterota bacterium]|jgi:DNA-binding NtrC family response regulator|nr:sigma-54 dependent transcriptional regulator [Thermodesulfobacteriota bacterium]
MPRILVVDDESRYCKILSLMLQPEHYEVVTATEGKTAARLLEEQDFDLILSDLFMEPFSGPDLLRHRNRVSPETPFIALTAFGSIPSAVELIKEGAFDYLTKPFQEEYLLAAVRNALKVRALAEENRNLKELLKESLGAAEFIGESRPVKMLLNRVQTVAPTDYTVLLLGETGTGKDLIARLIHRLGTTKEGPFVKINCAAIPSNLLESELFGHEKGAFTGAVARVKGKFQLAQGGTLFLDEISELDLSLQAKTLQAIEDKRFYPLGSSREVAVGCRILASSNRTLKELVEQGKFRPDLLHRLMAFPVHIPALRERQEDIPLLSTHFLNVFGAEIGRPDLHLNDEAHELLAAYPWPGNVRELMNVLRSAALLNREGVVGVEALSAYPFIWGEEEREEAPTPPAGPSPLPTLAEAERDLIRRALDQAMGNKTQAAKMLGISRSHLRYRMILQNLT